MATLPHNHTSHLLLRDAADVYVAALKSAFKSSVALFTLYRERIVAREQLLSMSPKMLDDIGVSQVEAMREATKPFWKA